MSKEATYSRMHTNLTTHINAQHLSYFTNPHEPMFIMYIMTHSFERKWEKCVMKIERSPQNV